MRRYIYNFYSLLIVLIFSACEKNPIEEQELPYLFRPVNIVVDASSTTVKISWSDLQKSDSYKVEIYQDNLEFINLVDSETVTKPMYSTTLEGDMLFSLRIKALSDESGKESKFVENVTFRTPKENLFKGYESRMISKGEAEVRWLPNSEVTKIVLYPSQGGASPIEVLISDKEKEAGYLTVVELENDTYTIEIKKEDITRGAVEVVIEGDMFLNSGENLSTAIASAVDGAVIILQDDGMFPLTSYINLNQSVKVRSMIPEKPATIFPILGYGGADLFRFSNGVNVDNIEFENVVLTGSHGNDISQSQVRYTINMNSGGPATVNNFLFTNCTIKNFFRTGIYMAYKTGDYIINNLSFIGCTIQNNGSGSSLAFISFYKDGADVHNITFRDCTVSKLQNNLIYGAKSEIESVTLENCTFNEIVMNPSSARLFLDFVSTTAVGAGEIRIINCILGETQLGLTKGVRAGNELSLIIEGSYATADFDDTHGNSIKDILKTYTGNSTSLWVDPKNGDFSFLDNNFEGKLTAGDPRWR